MKFERTAPSRRAGKVCLVAALVAVAAGTYTAGCGGSAGKNAPSVYDETADAGDPPQFTTTVPDGGPLEARIQVNGGNTVCGTCAVLVPQAQGGSPPYSFSWSDPSLDGDGGAIQVCPEKPTQYGLTVTDSSGSGAGEITKAAQKVQVTASVDCVAAGNDAAVTGCQITSTQDDSPDASMVCPANVTTTAGYFLDGGVYNSSVARVAAPLSHLAAGQSYTFSYDRVLPFVVGGGSIVVDVYGSNAPDVCTPLEKLFTMHLDGSLQDWNQTYCFTPTRDYEYTIANDANDGVAFYQTIDITGTLCAGTCQM
jgi:hypothetical protein